ncbi:MAG: hypothetical protein JXR03_20910 [Cyclobacteriaceae bacterium]
MKYKQILIATKGTTCLPLVNALNGKQHNVYVALPTSHAILQAAFASVLTSDQIILIEEGDLSEQIGYDLILYHDYTPSTLTDVPTVEIHFGQVPESYGADPLFWALKQGKHLAYISLIQHHKQADHVTLLSEKNFDIMPGENLGILTARLGVLMVAEVEEVLKGIGNGKTVPNSKLVINPMPTEKDFTIDWNSMEALQIEHLVDACNPKYGGARTLIQGAHLQILEVSQANVNTQDDQPPQPSGTIIYASADQGLFVACKGKTFLRLNILSTGEGFFTGQKLSNLGTQPGILLG